METLSIVFIFMAYIGIRLLLGHHRTPAMKDKKRYAGGIRLVQKKKYSEGLVYFKRRLQEDPKSAVVHACKGKCHFFMGDLHQALQAFQKALNTDYSLKECYLYTGKIYYQLEEYRDALTEFDKAVWHFREIHAEAFYWRALCQYQLKNFHKARYDFHKAANQGSEEANLFLLQLKSPMDLI